MGKLNCFTLMVALIASILQFGYVVEAQSAQTNSGLSHSDVTAGQQPLKFITIPTAERGRGKVMSAAMANLLNKYTPLNTNTEIMAGISRIGSAMNKKRAELVVLTPSQPLQAYKKDRNLRLRLLATAGGKYGLAFLGIHTTKKSGIKTVSDLRGKRVYAETPTAVWADMFMDAVLGANGMTRKDVKWLIFGSVGEAVRDLIEGRVDAAIFFAGRGTREVGSSPKGVYIVPLTAKEQAAIHEKDPGFSSAVLPAGYEGLKSEVPVVGAPSAWWLRPGVNNITAYLILKTMYDNATEFHAVHPALKGFLPEYGAEFWQLPYHAGSIQYFREIGIWTVEMDKKQKDLLEEDMQIYGQLTPEEALSYKKLGILK